MLTVNSKDNNSQINTLIIILLIVLLLSMFSGFYFLVFNGKLSNQPQDWASFGSYISGVLMPIFTAINIWVFVRLTQTISEKQKEFQNAESIRQDERHKNELDHQKRLIITQIRQTEIALLSKILDNSFIPESSRSDAFSKYNSYKINLAKSLSEIDTFINEKQYLFPLDKNGIAFKSLIECHKMIIEILNQYDDPCYIAELGNFLEIKHKAMIELYQYTTDNITN